MPEVFRLGVEFDREEVGRSKGVAVPTCIAAPFARFSHRLEIGNLLLTMAQGRLTSNAWLRDNGLLWVAAILLVSAVGCGDGMGPTAHLAGKVTLFGKPVPSDAEGSITFIREQPQGKKASVTVPVVAGQYDSPETPQGNLRAFIALSRKGKKRKSARTGEHYQEIVNILPPKYATGIQLEVNGDDTSRNFDL